jgi:hypothetical protein
MILIVKDHRVSPLCLDGLHRTLTFLGRGEKFLVIPRFVHMHPSISVTAKGM